MLVLIHLLKTKSQAFELAIIRIHNLTFTYKKTKSSGNNTPS